LHSQRMNFGLKQRRQRLIDESMALQRIQSLKAGGHNFKMKVPFAARTAVTGVCTAVIAHFQVRRLQVLQQQALDVRDGGGRGLRHGGSGRERLGAGREP
jgi:hypothetical protein